MGEGVYQMHQQSITSSLTENCSKRPGQNQNLMCNDTRSDRFKLFDQGNQEYKLKSVSHGSSESDATNGLCAINWSKYIGCDDATNARRNGKFKIQPTIGDHVHTNSNSFVIKSTNDQVCKEFSQGIKCRYDDPTNGTSYYHFTKDPPSDGWCTHSGSTFEYFPGCGYTCKDESGRRGIYGVRNAEWPNAPVESCPAAFGGSGSGMTFNQV